MEQSNATHNGRDRYQRPRLGYRYYADGPTGHPDWGLRFTLTFLFPE